MDNEKSVGLVHDCILYLEYIKELNFGFPSMAC